MTPRTGIWLIVKPLIQYKPLFLLFQAVQTSIVYKLILLTERVLGLRKMRSVVMWKTAILTAYLPGLVGKQFYGLLGFFFFFWGGVGVGVI